jgi:molecular chaperone DnaK
MLVGGMTRMPMIRDVVTRHFGKTPVTGVNPDEAVALGAAVHAAEIDARRGQTLLIDVASHTLSVGVLGGSVRRLIPKNAPVPATARESFLPSKTGQKQARISVYQGESDFSDECTKLGEVVLQELSGIHRADVPLEVSFELSNEGTLSVRAVDTTTGMAEALRIEARTTLSTTEVDALSREQASYAQQQTEKDRLTARAAFPRVLDKAERLVRLLEKSAEENPSPEAMSAVGQVKALLAQGRVAIRLNDTFQMAEVTRLLEQLVAIG